MKRERIIAAIVAIMLVTGSLIMGACGSKDSKDDSSSSSKVEETTTAPVTTEEITTEPETTVDVNKINDYDDESSKSSYSGNGSGGSAYNDTSPIYQPIEHFDVTTPETPKPPITPVR